MTNSLSELIGEKLEVMPSGERRAAQTLMADYPLVGLKTVAEFASQAGVSSPTILRFVSRLQFNNYASFQSALHRELAAQVQSPLARSRSQAPLPAASGASAFAKAVINNVEETFAHLSPADIGRIVALLSDPKRRIFLVGGRFTNPLAAYMAAHLRVIRSGVTHISGQESYWNDQLVDMRKRDILIIFDIRRYQESLLAYAAKAAGRRVAVILFTDQWLSPVARVARHVITSRTAAPSAWDSSAALFAVVEALIAEITNADGTLASRRIADLEAIRGAS